MKEFETRLERLESLAEKIRESDLPLEEAVKVFEEGMKLSKTLKKELEKIQAKIEILTADPESNDGSAKEDFDGNE